ncbi:putative ribosomal protein L9 [Dioscorea sansibarensis]
MASALRHLASNHSSVRVTNPLLFAIQGLRYRKLEVILTTNVDKLGKAGETVKVAPGHFRNHLMPKLLAVPNIDKYAFLIREQRKLYQREEVETVAEVPKTEDTDGTAMKMEDEVKEYQGAANQLDKARLVLRRLIKVDNELRSPVTKEELVAEVARQLCVSIHPDNLHLPSPLSSLGEYEIPLRLPRSIPRPEGKLQWTLNVKIRRK